MYWGCGGTSSLTASNSIDLFPRGILAPRSSVSPAVSHPQQWWSPICLGSSPRPFIHMVNVAGKMSCLSWCLLKKVLEGLAWGVCLALLLWLQAESTIPPSQHHHCKFQCQQGAEAEIIHWCLSQIAGVKKVSWLLPARTLEPGVEQTCVRQIRAEHAASQQSHSWGCLVWGLCPTKFQNVSWYWASSHLA